MTLFRVITRRAKSGNIILEIPEKEHADHLAEVLKTIPNEAEGVRRPSSSIPLIFIDEAELYSALVELDGDLKDASDFTIREERTEIRTAIIRVPLKAGTKLIHTKWIKVGWAYTRIKEFNASEQACNKCREKEHSIRECTGHEKRKCYRCKEIGHTITNCNIPDGRVGPKPNP
ncbi:cold shock domain-containing protein 3-like, partial [Aphis craccivora]